MTRPHSFAFPDPMSNIVEETVLEAHHCIDRGEYDETNEQSREVG